MEGECYLKRVLKIDETFYVNDEIQGEFKNGLLFTGSVKGNQKDKKNLQIEFKEGIGRGNYSGPEGDLYKGGFIQMGEDWVRHGKGVTSFPDGTSKESIYNRGELEMYLKRTDLKRSFEWI